MAMAGLYRRILPSPPAVEFASSDGKQLFAEALQSGTMEGFFNLISYFQTQSEPAYCGLASLSMVLNALSIDPGRKWRGPWRWFDESMLDCCEPLEKVKAQGITFGKVACLAHCAGASVEAFRTNQTSIDDFRRHVIACTSSEDRHLIASYHRGLFKQTGSGHFSPIGGYHAGQDMALILDVARFKYPPHWVPLSLLWDAMSAIDEATGHHRGFMLISKIQKASSLLFTLTCKHEGWTNTAKFLIEGIPCLLVAEDIDSVQKVLSVIFTSLPTDVEDFVKWVAEVRIKEEGVTSLSEEEKARLDVKGELLQLVHESELYEHISEWLASASCCCKEASSPHEMQTLNEIAAKVCCQGAELLSWKMGGPGVSFCCRKTCVRCIKANGGSSKTLISGTVTAGKNKQGVEVLVPVIQKDPECTKGCVVRHPGSNDVLTVLLLALPPDVWSGIKDKNLLNDFFPLVMTERLPLMLQDEVLHLRRQLLFLKRCQDGKLEDELGTALLG